MCKNEVQEHWPLRRYTTNRTQRILKNNIKLPQPFEDFADNHVVLPEKSFWMRSKPDFDDTIFAYDYRARATSIRHDFRPSTSGNLHLWYPHVSYECRVLIYTTQSVVKSWRMVVAHASRKQKSCRLNRPLLTSIFLIC